MSDLLNAYKQVQKTAASVPYTLKHPVRVIGVGSAGSTFVHGVASKNAAVDYITAITDTPDHNVGHRIQLGGERNSCDDDASRARTAAEKSAEDISRALQGSQMAILTAGLGAGTGTGATPVIADLCNKNGVFNVSVITHPFDFEGENYQRSILVVSYLFFLLFGCLCIGSLEMEQINY